MVHYFWSALVFYIRTQTKTNGREKYFILPLNTCHSQLCYRRLLCLLYVKFYFKYKVGKFNFS